MVGFATGCQTPNNVSHFICECGQTLLSFRPGIEARVGQKPQLELEGVEDCRTRASRPPQTHCRYKAVDGPSSRYTAQ
jgi:hypothetical protein